MATVTAETSQSRYGTRCNPPVCVRVLNHEGRCRPSWFVSGADLCGAWMRYAKEHCARRRGHRGWGGVPDHRTRYALDNNRDSYRSKRSEGSTLDA